MRFSISGPLGPFWVEILSHSCAFKNIRNEAYDTVETDIFISVIPSWFILTKSKNAIIELSILFIHSWGGRAKWLTLP